jgi:hypothetical protein
MLIVNFKDKVCESRDCDISFTTKYNAQKYCCNKCAKREARKRAKDNGKAYKCLPKKTYTCAHRNCQNKFRSRRPNAMYCSPEHAKSEAYFRKADEQNPDRRKKHMTYAYEKKNEKFKIPHFSAQWLEDLWNKRAV